MRLNGVLVKDLKGDTLLSSGQVRVNITDWFFFKDKIELKYIGLKDTYVHFSEVIRFGITSSWQIISGQGDTSEKKTIQLFIRDFDVQSAPDRTGQWKGEDMELKLAGSILDAEQLDLSKKMAIIHLLKITQTGFFNPKL